MNQQPDVNILKEQMAIVFSMIALIFGSYIGAISSAKIWCFLDLLYGEVDCHSNGILWFVVFLIVGFVPLIFIISWFNWWWERKLAIVIINSAFLGIIFTTSFPLIIFLDAKIHPVPVSEFLFWPLYLIPYITSIFVGIYLPSVIKSCQQRIIESCC